MKLFRHGAPSYERPGVLDHQGRYRDLSGLVPDISGAALTQDTLRELRALDLDALPLLDAGVRIGPCVAGVGNFIGIGLNYADHAAEARLPLPSQPLAFNKAPSCIAGPCDPLVLPPGSREVDYEIELAVVLCRDAWQVGEDQASACVGGYCLSNDFTDRHWQANYAGQWTIAKSAPGFGPLGPWLVTPDEIPDPTDILLELQVNGHVRQRCTTAGMVFKVPALIAYLSSFFQLYAGDVITTGTPAGVGMASGRYLKAGDQITANAGVLGTQRITVVSNQGTPAQL
ncbi:fumarylacetoacetate hydrolase family protein [Pusillimonas sp. T7-7]|uniref:fumarylacetoacetate hydrolase family protein n=1 Tax=Pusillimonas sp. (strain T7-7) TaxID=1007105 RepID=UPI0005A2581A